MKADADRTGCAGATSTIVDMDDLANAGGWINLPNGVAVIHAC